MSDPERPLVIRRYDGRRHNAVVTAVTDTKGEPMRILLTVVAIVITLSLAVAPASAGQHDVDIATIGTRTLEQDPQEILARLQKAPPANDLPSPFSEPAYIDPSTMSGTSTGIDESSLAGIVGTALYSFVYEPGGIPATPGAAPVASPQAGGPVRLYSVSSLHYVVFDHEVSPDALIDLNAALKTTLGDEAAASEVHEVTINDTPAYRFAMDTEINDVPIHAEWIAIPVGSVAVISMAMSGGEDVDLETLAADAEALALTGIGHLDTVISAPKPAG